MKVDCEYAVQCAIPERDCIHKKDGGHEKMEFACRRIYCQLTRKWVQCKPVKGRKE
jgi:hypothetical protein